jgi:hypothetical protein
LATATVGQLACARCGAALAGKVGPAHIVGFQDLATHGVDLAEETTTVRTAPLTLDEWEFEHDLRALEGLVAAAKAGPGPMSVPALPTVVHATQTPSVAPPITRASARPRTSRFAWFVLGVGILSFIAGGTLLALAYVLERDDCWGIGMPVTVAGQVCLLLGLVLQLERVWRVNRYAVDKLGEFDQRLADLNQSTRLLGVTHGSAAQAFYAHMAEGASPHLLLADLKGQLDLLAVRMSQRR